MTPEKLRELVSYDPSTGSLTWKDRVGDGKFNSRLSGKPAFAQPSKGYLTGRMLGGNYKAHGRPHTKVLLVVLTTTSSCTLDNLDSTSQSITEMKDVQTCQLLADQMDAERAVRAFCIEVPQ